MAKGNPILGYGRGKVGSIVLTRSKGQQIFKARNTKPHNAKTYPSVIHRARLSTLYKFCRYMPVGLLVGAYQDQRKKETWQSCFIRHNVKRAPAQKKDSVNNANVPCWGAFMMSFGTIRLPNHFFNEIEFQGYFGANGLVFSTTTAPTTIRDLSQYMIAAKYCQEGDIISFVRYKVRTTLNMPTVIPPVIERRSQIEVVSLVVSLTDERPLSDILVGYEWFLYPDEDENTWGWFGFRYTNFVEDSLAVIITRKDGERTLASESYLKGRTCSESWLQYLESDEWLDQVATSWGVTKQAILDYHGEV